MYSNVEKAIAEKLLWAYEDGSPIAPSNELDAIEMASVVRRRWNSFERRHKNTPKTAHAIIDDLARGMAEKFTDGGWAMVGPLINDYLWLAEQVMPFLDTAYETESRQGDLWTDR